MEDFLHRARGGPGEPAKPKPRAKFLGSDGRELKRPGIQGWACLYGKAFFASGRYRVIKSGAFIETIYDGQPKQLLFNHDPSRKLGSTADGLEFANSLDGLAFRMPLDGNPCASQIYDAVMQNEKACVSIGAEVQEKKIKRTNSGVDYDYCSKVTLQEVSLCEEGAVSGTYARIVDLDEEEPNLWLACRALSFASDKAVANATASAKRIADKLNSLRV